MSELADWNEARKEAQNEIEGNADSLHYIDRAHT